MGGLPPNKRDNSPSQQYSPKKRPEKERREKIRIVLKSNLSQKNKIRNLVCMTLEQTFVLVKSILYYLYDHVSMHYFACYDIGFENLIIGSDTNWQEDFLCPSLSWWLWISYCHNNLWQLGLGFLFLVRTRSQCSCKRWTWTQYKSYTFFYASWCCCCTSEVKS